MSTQIVGRFSSLPKAASVSVTATILTIVGTIAALAVGLGIFGVNVEGIIIAITSDGVIVVGLIANSIHSDSIEPSAFAAAVMALVGQAVALLVAFAWVTNAEASHIIAIASAVVLGLAQIAHALLSRQVLVQRIVS
jgi:hypothetical protein